MNRTESLLVDASVWSAIVDPADRYFESARALALGVEAPVAALDLTLYEIANAVGVKRGYLEQARGIARLVVERCRGELLAVGPDLIDAACAVAAEHSLTAYDAAYVAAARRHGMTLVSADLRDLVDKGLAIAPDAAL